MEAQSINAPKNLISSYLADLRGNGQNKNKTNFKCANKIIEIGKNKHT